jgi:hypothetical protein
VFTVRGDRVVQRRVARRKYRGVVEQTDEDLGYWTR